jgi:tetratricopeptide (TPR) repeat protein
MSTPNKHSLLAAMLVTMIAGALSSAIAQAPATQSPTPPSSPSPPPVATAPAVQATPEQLGDAMMAHQRYQAAIEAYKKSPGKNPAVWNKMGIAYQLMFNQTDAMHCYEVSHKLDPKNANVLNNLGTVYDALKQYHNAEKQYRKALKLDPESALIRKNLGTNLLAQHKYQKGWQEYQAAVKLDPSIFSDNSRLRIENPASISDRGAMNYYMAKTCVKAGMPQQAIQYLRMALNEGFTSPKKIIEDNEFAALQGIPAFEEMLAAQVQNRGRSRVR